MLPVKGLIIIKSMRKTQINKHRHIAYDGLNKFVNGIPNY